MFQKFLTVLIVILGILFFACGDDDDDSASSSSSASPLSNVCEVYYSMTDWKDLFLDSQCTGKGGTVVSDCTGTYTGYCDIQVTGGTTAFQRVIYYIDATAEAVMIESCLLSAQEYITMYPAWPIDTTFAVTEPGLWIPATRETPDASFACYKDD